MDIRDYQKLAMRTSPEGHDRALNGCLGLIGEGGEVVDVIKKWLFQSEEDAPMPVEKLVDECGDVLWYCAELAEDLGADVAELYERQGPLYSEAMERLQADNAATPMVLAVHLASACMRPYAELYMVNAGEAWKRDAAGKEIAGIMVMVRTILEKHCASSLEEAMRRNIAKLKERYPDGFDPERSMHRTR